MPEVVHPVDEPLVAIEHRRIRNLHAYWHAGWYHARPVSLLRAEAMRRLSAVVEPMPDRFGLAVFDAWRPLALQVELYEAAYSDPAMPPGFVAPPSDHPKTPSPHLTGGTVDLTLTIDGIPMALGTRYDDFTGLAAVAALEGAAGPDRDLRRLLYWAMRAQGFVVLAGEWWHFEYGTRRWAAIRGCAPLYGPASP
jgi:D-alanyl-D-alanine dipeptidase